ncbi:MAG: DUF6194 family protein [Pseudomonadota bacterium]
MTPDQVLERLAGLDRDVVITAAWGETTLFLNPGGRWPRGAYFATVKMRDGPNDRASGLDRPGVFRVNLGVQRADFVSRFDPPPRRPGKGGVVEGGWAFAALDRLTPHPVYGWMGWVSILSPSAKTLDGLAPLAESALARAGATLARRR